LFPAIAVAQALSRKDPRGALLYVGRRRGMEAEVVARYGIPLQTIVAAKLDMEQRWRNWTVAFVVPRALYQAQGIIRRFKPDVVLGTGGYVSAPLILAAATMRVPIVLQEQNYLPGRTTRLLARLARVVATAYPESATYLHARTVVTGTPVRIDFWRRRTDFPPGPHTLLVLGGSQGAHRINEAVLAAVPDLVNGVGLEVWHQTGDRDAAWLAAEQAKLDASVRDRYHPFGFAHDLPERIYRADLVLSRAGAATLAEVSAAGIPMVLVPGPFAGGHQALNAAPYERAGAAAIISDADCTGPRLTDAIRAIATDHDRYAAMVTAMRSLGRPYAAEEVVTLLDEVAARH
jgi:UDP-N-acetylglucosamine--N-acetylmuramyl-(pentapeptide) pyrophosphoryl-undecaprenol N-acetylglucosamine transferase